jgi:hypothetical protein
MGLVVRHTGGAASRLGFYLTDKTLTGDRSMSTTARDRLMLAIVSAMCFGIGLCLAYLLFS